MRNRKMLMGMLVAACIAACGAVAAGETAKIVDEKVIFTLSDDANRRENRGVGSMRLSPDGTKLLYIRRHVDKDAQRAYHLVIRDIEAGKDKELKILPYGNDDIAAIMISAKVFGPAGKRLVLGIGVDKNKDGWHDPREEPTQAIVYDLATDKITKVGACVSIAVASFDRTGKGLVLLAADVRARTGAMYTTPVDKIKLRRCSQWGLPRGICPTADVIVLLLFPPAQADPGPRTNKLVLFDLAKNKITATLPVRPGNTKLDDYTPHWTADGRYLYYVGADREPVAGDATRQKYESRIWDRIKGQLAPEVGGMIPLGPGPTATTMVLCPYDPTGKLAVHDAKAEKTWLVDAPDLRSIGSEGKYVLYVRRGKAGKEIVCRGRIKLPGK